MPLFTYRWLDLIRMLPGSLTPPRLIIGTVLAAWCFAAWMLLTGLLGESPLTALGIDSGDSVAPGSIDRLEWVEGLPGGALVLLTTVVWWFGFCWLKLWLMRAEVLRIGLAEPRPIPRAAAFAWHFAPRLARSPLALIPWFVGALVRGVPLAILGLLVGLITPELGPVTLALFGLFAPTGLVIVLWFLTLPLSFAAMSIHAGDGFEAVARGLTWGLRGARWYATVAVLSHKAVAVMLWISWDRLVIALDESDSFSLVAWLCATGVVFAAWTMTDVVIALIVRHRVDHAPVTEVFEPRRVFAHRISTQERALSLPAQSD